MEAMTNINIRMSVKDKEIANSILESMGLNMTTLINMTVKQLINKRKIPFEIVAPTDDEYLLQYFTKEELENTANELKYIENHLDKYKSYKNLNELKEDLLSNDET